MELRALVGAVVYMLISTRESWTIGISERMATFSQLDLAGYEVLSPLSVISVSSPSQCARICLQTTGCTSVAMLDGMCLPFDGRVKPTAHVLYTKAYELSSRADKPCTRTEGHPICDSCHERGDNCYYIGTTALTWSAASRKCVSFGGNLTDIRTPEENGFLIDLLDQVTESLPYGGSFWIGGVKENGALVWVSTHEVINSYVAFAIGEPNGPDELCFAMWNATQYNYGWVDAPCSTELGFVCKVPLH